MSEISASEERAILNALEELEGDPAATPPRPAADLPAPERAYVELLGLLAYGLDPVAPSPELKQRVMEAAKAADGEPPRAVRPAPPPVAPLRRPARPGSRWLPLAAALALVAIGVSVFLGYRSIEQSRRLADLNRRLDEVMQRSERLAEVRHDLSWQLAMVTSPGIEVCPLRPQGEEPPQPRAHGLLFLSPERGAWYLRIRNLEPRPDGVYTLWFLRDGAPINGGVLTPGPDLDVELTNENMPSGPWMNGVAVTLESGPSVDRPTGPMLLFGDEKMTVL